MKKLVLAILILIFALAVTSCYWISGVNGGTIRVDLSSFASKGLGDRYARIWLVANNKIFALDEDRDYIQELIPQAETPSGYADIVIDIDKIPVGPTYKVWLSIVDQKAGRFETYVWAESAEFEMMPGDKVAVVFSEQSLYFSREQGLIFNPVVDNTGSPTMMDKKLIDVEVFADTVYAADKNTLYKLSFDFNPGFPNLSVFPVAAPGGQTINSLSNGIQSGTFSALVTNTDQAIVPYNGEGSYHPSVSVNLGSNSILDSGVDNYPDSSYSVLFFRTADGWGGTASSVDSSPNDLTWLSQSSDKTLDLVVTKFMMGHAYFATKSMAFRFDGYYLWQLAMGTPPPLNDHIHTFQAPYPILSLGLISPDGDVLLMGTEKGAFSAWATGEPDVIGTPSVEEGTQGYPIRRIATYYDWPNFVAYLSDAYLFVRDPFSVDLLVFPLCAGLPGKITGMVWYKVPGAPIYYLIVTGSEGMVYLEFTEPV